jgi:hypothetical protein
MFAFVRLFLDICLLRKGPQHVPESGFLLGSLFLLDILISSLFGMMDGDLWDAMAQAFVAAVILLGFTAFLLVVTSHRSRFQKTATAALGCDAVITLFAFPMTGLSHWIDGASLLILVIVLWNFVVYAHILRNALGIGYALASILTLIQMMVSLDLMARIFGAAS